MQSLDRTVHELRMSVARVSSALVEARAGLPPEIRASDSSSAATVAIRPDGQIIGIAVGHGWQQMVRPENLAAAVMEAAGLAERALSEALSAQLLLRPEGHDLAVPGPTTEIWCGAPRPLVELAELALDRGSDGGANSPPMRSEGVSGLHVSISLDATSLVACRIDPAWARTQPTQALNSHLAVALQQARGCRDDGSRAHDQHSIVAHALAHLRVLAPDRDDSTTEAY